VLRQRLGGHLDGHRYVRVVPPVSHAIGLDAVVRRSPQTLATNSY
jgi:hypothetical protein